MKDILILDTGREWGGGTNSLIELLKRIDKKKYRFSALFYNDYKMGGGGKRVGEILNGLGVEFMLTPRAKSGLLAKAVKEAGRAALSFSPARKKDYVFSRDLRDRILPDSAAIEDVLRKRKPDMLYMNNQPSSNLEGILAAERAGILCVQHSRVDVRLNRYEAGAVNRAVRKVICVSKGVMDGLVNSGVEPSLCSVVYNGIDPGLKPKRAAEEVRSELGISPGTPVIGTVGSLIKRKRTGLLIDSLKSLEGGFAAVIVGEGPEMESLRQKAKENGIADKVRFTGFSADALSYINAFDIFVLPSMKEGLPRVVLEAMLMGKPAVAFDVTGPSELIVDGVTGLLVREESAGALAEAVKKTLRDGASMRAMGEAGRTRVKRDFGIENYISGVERVFKEVII